MPRMSQQEEQGVTFCVFEGEVGVTGQSLLAGVLFSERIFSAQVRLRMSALIAAMSSLSSAAIRADSLSRY